MKKITLIRADDWEGLYIDGKLAMENHQLKWSDIVKACEFKCDIAWADDEWMAENGRLPVDLKDVKIGEQI